MKYQLGDRCEGEIAKAADAGYQGLKVPKKDGDELQSHHGEHARATEQFRRDRGLHYTCLRRLKARAASPSPNNTSIAGNDTGVG